MTWKWWQKPVSPDRNLSGEAMERAQRAVNSLPILREACAEVREALMDQIIKSGPEDYEAREYFYHSVKGLDAAMTMVETYSRQQNMAAAMDAFKQKMRN
jgi:hypothetical protein